MPGWSTSWAPSCEANPRRCVQRVSLPFHCFHPSPSDPKRSLFDAPEPPTSLPTPSRRVAHHEIRNAPCRVVHPLEKTSIRSPQIAIQSGARSRWVGVEVSMESEGTGSSGLESHGGGGATSPWPQKGATHLDFSSDTMGNDGAQSLRASSVARHSCRGVEGDRVIAARERNLVLVLYCGLQMNHSSRSKSNGTGHSKQSNTCVCETRSRKLPQLTFHANDAQERKEHQVPQALRYTGQQMSPLQKPISRRM